MVSHGLNDTRGLRNIRIMDLAFHRVWLLQPCRANRSHVVIVSKDVDGRHRLTLVRRLIPVCIVRELVTEDDSEAIRVLGLLTTHADPAALCDCILNDGHTVAE
ncbi:MAG: hypothetical protein ACR2RE_17665, partial [Geminicoccaceae bacterium]